MLQNSLVFLQLTSKRKFRVLSGATPVCPPKLRSAGSPFHGALCLWRLRKPARPDTADPRGQRTAEEVIGKGQCAWHRCSVHTPGQADPLTGLALGCGGQGRAVKGKADRVHDA